MDDPGVARADLRADDVVALQNDHLATAQRQRARHRKPTTPAPTTMHSTRSMQARGATGQAGSDDYRCRMRPQSPASVRPPIVLPFKSALPTVVPPSIHGTSVTHSGTGVETSVPQKQGPFKRIGHPRVVFVPYGRFSTATLFPWACADDPKLFGKARAHILNMVSLLHRDGAG